MFGLFYVSIGNLAFQPVQEVASSDSTEDGSDETKINYDYDFNNQETNRDSNSDPYTKINIFISPGKNNFKYMELNQYEYYFSNLTYNRTSKNRPIETKVYSLTVENPKHDVMVIEISSCLGYFELNIQEVLITKDNIAKKSIDFTRTNEKGKNIIW